MIRIATPVSTLFSNKENINKINRYSDCLEGRENKKTTLLKNIELIHFDIDIHKKFKQKDIIEIKKLINNMKLECISFQMSSSYYSPILKNNKFYPMGKKLSKSNIFKNIHFNLLWLKKNINFNCKIAIENNNYYSTGAYDLVTDADFLTKILNKYNLYLLFDYSHAKITTHNKKILFNKYLLSLPLNKVIQIHFCGFEIINNEAIDTHITPNKQDYDILKELINICDNLMYITLEYYRDIDGAIDSLKKIKRIIKKNEL